MLHDTLPKSAVTDIDSTVAPPTEVAADSDEPPATADIDVRSAPGLPHTITINWIKNHLQAASAWLSGHENSTIARLSVLIVDDARMMHLHERHGGVAETTDVLTFDLREHADQPVEADLVICADEAARRAAEFQHPIERELLLYCVHGLLHCLGYDDHDEANWQRMHAREDEALNAIGVEATFAKSPSRAASNRSADEKEHRA